MGKINFRSWVNGQVRGTRDRALCGGFDRAVLTGPGVEEADMGHHAPSQSESPNPCGGEALLEARMNYYPVSAMLSEHLDLIVGHPPKVKAIAQTDKKTDRIDAEELSRLLWLGSVLESYVPTDEIRECRSLVRGCISLLQERTKYANKIHSLLSDNGVTQATTLLKV